MITDGCNKCKFMLQKLRNVQFYSVQISSTVNVSFSNHYRNLEREFNFINIYCYSSLLFMYTCTYSIYV